MSPSATPTTQSDGPRLPRKVTVDVSHACHAKCRGDHGGKREPRASPEPAQCHKCHACHAKRRSMSPSATPATQSHGRCHQVPGLPRKVTVDVTKCHAKCRRDDGGKREPSASPEPAQCHKSTPATQSDGRCHQVPRLPRKVTVDVTKYHACHAKCWATTAANGNQACHQSQPSAIIATPATQSDGRCHQVPHLPRKAVCE